MLPSQRTICHRPSQADAVPSSSDACQSKTSRQVLSSVGSIRMMQREQHGSPEVGPDSPWPWRVNPESRHSGTHGSRHPKSSQSIQATPTGWRQRSWKQPSRSSLLLDNARRRSARGTTLTGTTRNPFWTVKSESSQEQRTRCTSPAWSSLRASTVIRRPRPCSLTSAPMPDLVAGAPRALDRLLRPRTEIRRMSYCHSR